MECWQALLLCSQYPTVSQCLWFCLFLDNGSSIRCTYFWNHNTFSNTYIKGKLLTTENPDARYGEGLVFPKYTNAGKSSLAQFFNSLERSTYQVTGPKGHFKLIIILILSQPNGVVFLVKMFPKVWNRHYCVIVWVHPLEGIHVERAKKHEK